MPVPTPFHQRTAALCRSYAWKEWAGHCAVCRYETNHEPEYFAFRNAAGLLDVSPLQKYEVEGRDAAAFLTFVTARDIRRLKPGRVAYAVWCDDRGKVIDDGTIARLDEDRYRVTSAAPLLWWLERHARGFRVDLRETTASTAALAVQGPTARDVLATALGADLRGLRFFAIAGARIDGVEVEVSRTGYTGDLGYEVWLPADRALEVWDAIVAAGRDHGLQAAGLDALDMTRIEAGFVLQDVDYFSAPRCLIESRKSTPFEIGLGWTVQLDREPFVGQTALRAEAARGSDWSFVALDVDQVATERLYEDYGLPPRLPNAAWRTAVPVFAGRRQIGQATSGTASPILKRNIALATVRRTHAAPGTALEIEHTVEFERRTLPAVVVERPLFDPARKRE